MATAAGLVFVGLPVAASTHYAGTAPPLVLFDASFVVMLFLAIPRPRSYAYTFLAVFLLLGFWAKLNLHTLLDYAYQEPIGRFDGSGASWDTALLVASSGAIGISIARIIQIAWHRRPRDYEPPRAQVRVPAWFSERRKLVWIATAGVAVTLSLANLTLAFYEIGVDPRLVLPAHGNVIVAWLIKLGLALWIATLVHWELSSASTRPDRVFIAPVAEAVATSVSALSRGIFLFHVLPYYVVLLARSRQLVRTFGRRHLATLLALTLAGLVLSLGAVSALRLLIYPTAGVARALDSGAERAPDARSSAERLDRRQAGADRSRPVPRRAPPPTVSKSSAEERFGSKRLSFAVREVLGLVVERWSGMEGVMAISAHEDLGGDLLLSAVREDASRGQDALYQRISGANDVYDRSDGYTFLTLPGVVGILEYSGSTMVVVGGMAVLTIFMLGIETFFKRRIGNPYLASVVGLAMASELTQANFPHLLATFFILLCLSLSAIAVVAVGPRHVAKRMRRTIPSPLS